MGGSKIAKMDPKPWSNQLQLILRIFANCARNVGGLGLASIGPMALDYTKLINWKGALVFILLVSSQANFGDL